MGRDPILGRGTEFWGRKTSGNNDNETMINEKILMSCCQKLKFSEFEELMSVIYFPIICKIVILY